MALITRANTAGLIPVEYSNELLKTVPEGSWAMKLGRRLRDMSRYQTLLQVSSALSTAYFVSGDTGAKQTTNLEWSDVTLQAEELAVIVPIPENVLDDAEVPIWDEALPDIKNAIGKAVDQAVFGGTNIPASWNTAIGGAGIVAVATAKSNSVALGAGADLYDDLLGDGGVFSLVEADGFAVSGSVAHLGMKGKLRGVRGSDGQPIFMTDPAIAGGYMLAGAPTYFPTNGAMVTTAPLIAGDFSQLVYSIRKDVTWKVLTEAVIQDGAGNILYNLAQQDMVALRVVVRLGFALPNPVNRVNTGASRYPFAILTSA